MSWGRKWGPSPTLVNGGGGGWWICPRVLEAEGGKAPSQATLSPTRLLRGAKGKLCSHCG